MSDERQQGRPEERRSDQHREDHKVAIVLSGAGARGAFQAGVLATLLPALADAGTIPSILLGTSAGGINAALWASQAHHPVTDAADRLLGLWTHLSHRDVYAPLLRTTFTRTLEQFAAGAVLNRGKGTTSLFDTSPLRHTADRLLDTDQLARNVAAGTPEAVGVIATRVPFAADSDDGTASGRSVLFLHEQHPVTHPGDPDRAQDVMSCPLRREHVLASAAIPVAFPAVRVTDPPTAAGWYIDGGVRLNTPLRPAVALGATRIIVISANSTVYGPPAGPGASPSPPDVADAAGQVLHAVLADRLVEDLRQLRARNHLLAQLRALPGAAAVTLHRQDDTPYRTIEYITVSPAPGELGRLAARVLADKTRGFGAVREQDNYLLGQLLRGAGDGPGRRELLSYLFFDEDYFAQSIKCGHHAALSALAAGWHT